MSLLEAQLPEGRQWFRLGDAYEVTKKPRGLDVASLPEVPFVPMDAIPSGGAYAPGYTMRPPGEIRSGTYFERGDALIAKITPSFENGKQALVTDLPTHFGFATTEVIPLRPCKEGQDKRLLFFYLLHPDVRHHIAGRMEGATGRQRVPQDVLIELPFPKFKQEEQAAIADSLEMIQCLKAVEMQSIQAANNLKRSAMRTLFTCGLRGETQRETEIGPIPESWNFVTFASVREKLQYGTSVRCTYDVSGHPVLRIPNIEPQRVTADDLKYCTLTGNDAAKYQLEVGDLIFIRTNGVLDRLGSCAVYDGNPAKALFASYLIRARVKQEYVTPHFAAAFFGSEVGTSIVSARAISASDGKFNLNTAAIDSLQLPLPPTLSEQREIVAVLDTIDHKIELHRRKHAVLEALFKALLHKLMTGEISVDELDLAAIAAKQPIGTGGCNSD
ncbi:MAG: restriction endonuclease subunit S [Gammaproteobacteria bacterium]|nr:restriction endonuclease subunit S [Gammaproteobacteria bacterium]